MVSCSGRLNAGRVKALYASNAVLLALLVVLPWLYYGRLPGTVPTHWDLSGRVTSTGSRLGSVALLSAVMPLGNLIILVVYTLRWRILEKYPYLVNLPAIAILLGSESIPPPRKRELVDEIFSVMLVAGFLIGIYLLILELGILESMRTSTEPSWLMPFSIAGAILMVAPPLILYRKIYREEILPLVENKLKGIKAL